MGIYEFRQFKFFLYVLEYMYIMLAKFLLNKNKNVVIIDCLKIWTFYKCIKFAIDPIVAFMHS